MLNQQIQPSNFIASWKAVFASLSICLPNESPCAHRHYTQPGITYAVLVPPLNVRAKTAAYDDCPQHRRGDAAETAHEVRRRTVELFQAGAGACAAAGLRRKPRCITHIRLPMLMRRIEKGVRDASGDAVCETRRFSIPVVLLRTFEGGDAAHLVFGQCKVEHRDVLADMRRVA